MYLWLFFLLSSLHVANVDNILYVQEYIKITYDNSYSKKHILLLNICNIVYSCNYIFEKKNRQLILTQYKNLPFTRHVTYSLFLKTSFNYFTHYEENTYLTKNYITKTGRTLERFFRD